MDEAKTTILGDARAAVDHLKTALSSADTNARRKAKQDFSYGVEELVAVLIAAPPDASEVATACAIIAAACRVARAHGERVAADTNPAEIAIVDAWYIGEVLRRVPEERLAPAVRGQLLQALDTLREFDAPRVRKMIQSNRRMSDREVDEFLRNRVLERPLSQAAPPACRGRPVLRSRCGRHESEYAATFGRAPTMPSSVREKDVCRDKPAVS